MTTWKASLCALVFLAEITCGIQGHTIACDSASAESEEDRLAREVEDPTAILTQLQFQDLYTPRNFQTPAQTNTIQLRPIIPVEAFSLFPFQQIIRPTLQVKSLARSPSSSTITEFADMELFDLIVSNWPNPKETGFGWGVGPTFVFIRSGLPGHSALDGRIPLPESDFVCVHEFFGDTTKSNAIPAKDLIHTRSWLVCEIVGLDVDGQLASRYFDHDSHQPWCGSSLEGLGVAVQSVGDG